MPTHVRSALALLVVLGLALLSACSAGPSTPGGSTGGAAPGQVGAQVQLSSGTCWTRATLGSDPQVVLKLAGQFGVSYFDAAHALTGRPAFALTQSCSAPHAVEVYKAVSMTDVKPQVTTYTQLLQAGSNAYARLAANVARACMNQILFDAASATGMTGAVMAPQFPDSMTLGWAPPSPQQWAAGQRVYACTLTQARPSALLYAAVFTRSFPTEDRTCIDNKSLVYVDCARSHNRERIAVLEMRTAVAAGQLAGAGAISNGPDGRYVALAGSVYSALDRACTTYLRAISRTTRLSGVAEIDADQWPVRKTGSYPVACEADTPPTKKPLTTRGSVYDR